MVLLGPTGAGKTTTLRLVAGLERPDAGRICDRRRATSPRARPRRATSPSSSSSSRSTRIIPCSTIWPSPCARRCAASREDQDHGPRARDRDACCGSTASCDNRATRLSGGEMQRVAIGRALVREPACLPHGRAALLARRQAARGPADRAQAHPARPGRHHPLRHPRPDRGHDAGRPDRRARGRPAAPARHRRARSTAGRPASRSPAGWARRRSTSLPVDAPAGEPRAGRCRDRLACARRTCGSTAAGSEAASSRSSRSGPRPSCCFASTARSCMRSSRARPCCARAPPAGSSAAPEAFLFFDGRGRRLAA